LILVGELSLWVALLMAVWAATVSFAGGMQGRSDLIASGERGIHATLAMLLLASLGLWRALVTHDLSLEYVASFTSSNLPLLYTLAAFWGGPAGTLLLFTLLLSVCAAIVVLGGSPRDRGLLPYVTGTLAVVLAFALATLCLGVNPYERIDLDLLDGRGMNPLLQTAGMTVHPPSLYAGLAATAVPFAFGIAALLARRLDGDWLFAARRWVVGGWIFLTIGIVSGMWWAYGQPDWAGEWTRDAVDNAAVFPWLVDTALLYSLVARPERAASRKWSVVLLLLAFPLALFSAFLARGGIVSTAHSFVRSPGGGWLAGILVLLVAAATYLLLMRLPALHGDGEARAAARSARRWPGVALVSVGIVALLVALAGQAWRKDYAITLTPGASGEVRDPFGRAWQFTSQGVSQYNELNRSVVAAAVDVARAGRSIGILTTERRQYVDSRGNPTYEPATTAGMLGTPAQDVSLTLAEVGDDESVRLRVGFLPLVAWVWIGGLVSVLGGILLLVDAARRGYE
jgi:cytochrome c-type biogenesis protein CcmF